jgi:hypothetical protein
LENSLASAVSEVNIFLMTHCPMLAFIHKDGFEFSSIVLFAIDLGVEKFSKQR